MVIRIEWGADRLRTRAIILSLVAFIEHCFGPVKRIECGRDVKTERMWLKKTFGDRIPVTWDKRP